MSDWSPVPGEIVWLDFAPTQATEQSGRRPALTLSDSGYNAATGRAMVAPITSRARGWPLEVALAANDPVEGAVLVDQARCVDWRARFAKPAGFCAPATLEAVRGKLSALLGL
ncbi:type II toxin-antitoxin system PemK/MazF family toxin [Caulobacter sp. DWR2-3-1b2]|uniref:type II toxin-antitoxin system PemK/MazF family toxin n=1 Tax=unclassified Caulobacter TaxID=2648921 RepID=UPI003CF04342